MASRLVAEPLKPKTSVIAESSELPRLTSIVMTAKATQALKSGSSD